MNGIHKLKILGGREWSQVWHTVCKVSGILASAKCGGVRVCAPLVQVV